ncbi:hypothetical protein COHA_001532 [Chlorella ohadii]|uniref:Uncharacterized protein n=1 Tax=Chlorella ohadii TaxID=2649997 RepID=A0AAD5H5D8_9CHLO|nr:hypothetical protein COHA_001532 [Chlorella ohadii]
MEPNGASHHSHEVHLPQRKSAVADKPTHAHFSPEHYTGPAPRRQASARSPPPFAAEQGGSPADPAAPARYLQPHTPPQPSGKVSATAFAAEAYSSALQASATARQQRYAAAAGAQAPFAVKAGEGGVAEAEGVHAHLERPPQKDPSAKVTEQQLASRQAVEEGCKQRQAEASAARAKNWGSFVIG